MHAYQIFQQISPDLAVEILTAIRGKDREVFKTSMGSLASLKKLRPVFIQRKPLDQQIQWARKSLQSKPCDELAEQILQVWLLGCHQEMLVDFLDVLGVAHDGEGAVDNLPERLDAARLKAAVDRILASHDPAHVSVYMRLFQLQRPGGWEELETLLGSDERLALGGDDGASSQSASTQAEK